MYPCFTGHCHNWTVNNDDINEVTSTITANVLISVFVSVVALVLTIIDDIKATETVQQASRPTRVR